MFFFLKKNNLNLIPFLTQLSWLQKTYSKRAVWTTLKILSFYVLFQAWKLQPVQCDCKKSVFLQSICFLLHSVVERKTYRFTHLKLENVIHVMCNKTLFKSYIKYYCIDLSSLGDSNKSHFYGPHQVEIALTTACFTLYRAWKLIWIKMPYFTLYKKLFVLNEVMIGKVGDFTLCS